MFIVTIYKTSTDLHNKFKSTTTFFVIFSLDFNRIDWWDGWAWMLVCCWRTMLALTVYYSRLVVATNVICSSLAYTRRCFNYVFINVYKPFIIFISNRLHAFNIFS